jgi:hypothetical protein
MPILHTQCVKGDPLTVIYPAESLSGYSVIVRLRVGKSTVMPAYSHANLPHMVQFQRDQRIIMFFLSDVLQPSYWQRIRNAYNLFGQLDVDADVKVSAKETKRITKWLRQESAARGVTLDHCQRDASAGRFVLSQT